MASGQRKHSEPFLAYRARLKNEDFATKVKLRGKVLWNSALQGTYVRSVHGELGG